MTLEPIAASCPYLFHCEDPLAQTLTAGPANYCKRAQPAGPVRSGVQSRICMTVRHQACPLLLKDWNGPLPAYLKDYEKPGWKRKITLGLAAVSGVGATIAALLGGQSF